MKTYSFRSKPELIAILVIAFFCFMAANCHSANDKSASAKATGSAPPATPAKTATGDGASAAAETAAPINPGDVPDAATILKRPEVPILCYHQIRDWRPTDSKVAKDYIIPPASFREQMKMLADSGYHTILPDQLYAYLTKGAALPSKPVMITFDDTDEDQYTIGASELSKYGFKGVFFIMTVSLGRPHYMTKEQVKDLVDKGHAVESHTWDHHNVKKYQGQDWVTQIEKPTKQLETITGKKIQYFAYPFGLWNPQAFPELKKRGMIAAFSLYDKRDPNDPLFTIRRIITPAMSGPKLNATMKRAFSYKQ